LSKAQGLAMASLCCPVNGADDRTAIRVPVMSSHAVFVMPAVAAVLVAAMTADLPYWLLLLAIFCLLWKCTDFRATAASVGVLASVNNPVSTACT